LLSTHHGEWLSGWSGIKGIEAKLESDASATLSGFANSEISASGQDLMVTTSLPLSSEAQSAVGELRGVRSVDFRVVASEAAEPAETATPPVDVEPAQDQSAGVESIEDEPVEVDAAAVIAALNLDAVTFEVGTPILTDEARSSLDNAAVQLAQLDGVAIEVQGHTDATGDPDVNLLLSQDRAVAVADYLTAAGVDPALLTPKGYGGSRPLADNSTAEGQTANQRVELVVAEGTN